MEIESKEDFIMLVVGIILVILGILGKLFSSVSHITDSTAKAMGWTALNKIVSILSNILLVIGVLFIIGSFLV